MQRAGSPRRQARRHLHRPPSAKRAPEPRKGFYDWTITPPKRRPSPSRTGRGAGQPWNPPTSFTLAPGTSRVIGVRLVTAPSIRAIEDVLAAQEDRPVAVGRRFPAMSPRPTRPCRCSL
ncbi:DUF5695 domain-containing protein [Caulobacter segnis]